MVDPLAWRWWRFTTWRQTKPARPFRIAGCTGRAASLRPFQGQVVCAPKTGGIRYARPPATVCHPSGMKGGRAVYSAGLGRPGSRKPGLHCVNQCLESDFLPPNAQRPTPNAQRPTPNAQRPTPNAQRPTPNGECPLAISRTPTARNVSSRAAKTAEGSLRDTLRTPNPETVPRSQSRPAPTPEKHARDPSAALRRLGMTTRESRIVVTSHLSPLTSHLSPLTSHLSPLTSHLSPLTSHAFRIPHSAFRIPHPASQPDPARIASRGDARN